MPASDVPFVKERIAAILNLFPNVRWDTVIDERGEVDVLGWIEPEEDSEEWIVLLFAKRPPQLLGFLSSTVVPEPRDAAPAGEEGRRREFPVDEYFGELVRRKVE